MPPPFKMRIDYFPAQLRVLAKSAKTNSQSRRLLSLAAVLDGMNRTDAARIGGMERQTLRDWVHRFNQLGPDGLCDVHAGGVEPRLSVDQKAELAAPHAIGPSGGCSAIDASRNLVSGRSAHRTKERCRSPMGEARLKATPTPAQLPPLVQASRKLTAP